MTTASRIAADHAVVTIGRVREAWDWVADAVEPGRRRVVERHLSDAARARLGRLAAAERADRIHILRAGHVPSTATPAAANLAAVDARAAILEHLDDVAWRVASALRRAKVPAYRQTGSNVDERVAAALDYLADRVHDVEDTNLVNDVCARLHTVDELARAAAGVGPDRRPLKAPCPSCGRRSLVSETGSPNYREWAILCTRTDCRCRGVDCACKRPIRYPGPRHVWPEKEWDQLAVLLAAREAA